MTPPASRYALMTLAFGPLVVLVLASHLIWGSGEACYAFWQEWGRQHPAITEYAKTITTWGNPLAYAVYAVVFARALYTNAQDDLRLVVCYIIIQLIVALGLTHLLKNIFGMPRPFMGEVDPLPWVLKAAFQSFPSGHTTEIVGAVLPLALWRRRLPDTLLCSVWIASVAYSRVYLGSHYLMDIWGGLALGTCAGLAIMYFAHPAKLYTRKERLSAKLHTLLGRDDL